MAWEVQPLLGGNLKSLMSLVTAVLHELGTMCAVSTDRDLKTIAARVEDEGESFLTITLADFGKDFQKSLALGRIAPDGFLGFKRTAGLPRFLSGFLELVFDRATGVLLDDPSTDAIFAVRQVSLMSAKVSRSASPRREAAAMRGFIECEKSVRDHDSSRKERDLADFRRVSRLLFAGIFARIDARVYACEVIPRHGPGATADRIKGNRKWDLSVWTDRLEAVFPYVEYGIPSYRYWNHRSVEHLEPGAELPVRVISVPKTLKTPRIIAIEPTCMQYMQQALSRELVSEIEGHDTLSSLIGFTDQTPNQRMAREGSISGALATLDLSEASDRVSNQLVRELFAPHPWLAKGVDACRSRKADVPGHGVVRLAKFASMGSALCFPVEAMVFLTIALIGIEKSQGRRLSRSSIRRLRGRVRVYGDDIIVPSTYAACVSDSLEDFGLRVNRSKSFWTGRFRESCGKDWYDGVDVTPVRVRRSLPLTRDDTPEVISAVSLRNQLYKAGFRAVPNKLDKVLTKILRYFPVVAETSPVLGRHNLEGITPERMCPNLHVPLVKGHVVVSRPPESKISGVGSLHKVFTLGFQEDPEHLERHGRPNTVRTKVRWAHAR